MKLPRKKIESMIVHYNHFECYIASSECHGEIVVANANYSNVFDHALEIGLENRRLLFSRCLLLHYRAQYGQIQMILSKNDETILANLCLAIFNFQFSKLFFINLSKL